MGQATQIVTAEELRELLKAPVHTKYRSKRCDCGQRHHSLKECRRSYELQMMERAGAISDLKEQVPFELAPAVVLNGRKKPALKLVVDFVYYENGELVLEDTKGVITQEWRIKTHILKWRHGLEVRLS